LTTELTRLYIDIVYFKGREVKSLRYPVTVTGDDSVEHSHWPAPGRLTEKAAPGSQETLVYSILFFRLRGLGLEKNRMLVSGLFLQDFCIFGQRS
jgi:hypothetical protein